MTKLAIAAARFGGPSITFIRDHVSYIAPGKTVLLSRVNEDPGLNCEYLSGLMPPDEQAVGFVSRAVRRVFGEVNKQNGPQEFSASEISKAKAFLHRHNTSALLVEFLTEASVFMRVAQATKIPLFAHAHGFDATNIPMNSQAWMNRYQTLFDVAAGIFCPSQYIANRLVEIGCDPNKITISPCGVNPATFVESNRVDGMLLAVGRLVPKKAPQITIQAFSKIAASYPNSKLHIIGDGPLRNQCVSLVSHLGLKGRVIFYGAQPREFVLQKLKDASIFVQHSVVAPNGDTEGLPVAILEAMASGIPIISTNHSGIPEAVLDGQTGYLVTEHDVEAMADRISTLLGDRALGEVFGNAGRLRVNEQFTTEVIGKRIRHRIGLR